MTREIYANIEIAISALICAKDADADTMARELQRGADAIDNARLLLMGVPMTATIVDRTADRPQFPDSFLDQE